MNPVVRKLGKAMVPRWLRAIRWRRIAKRHREIAKRLHKQVDGKVVTGPFKGMQYLPEATGSMLGPKLLGSYELEIHGFIQEFMDHKAHHALVDVGCAEGYYAVGFAQAIQGLSVFAYDIDERARELTQKLSSLNHTDDRVSIRGEFNGNELKSLCEQHESVFLLMDTDGAEDSLLDPSVMPELREIDILVETHDCFAAGVTERLIERFGPTHKIRKVDSRKRLLSELPEIDGLEQSELLEMGNEHRPDQSWLWMTKE